MALAENELAERDRRRIERHLAARLLPGKTLDNFHSIRRAWSPRSRSQRCAAAMSGCVTAPICFSWDHPATGNRICPLAIGLALLEKGSRVLFARTSDLVQRLQVARRELALEAAMNRLDNFHVLILDDLA